jgi:hypothetical protein
LLDICLGSVSSLDLPLVELVFCMDWGGWVSLTSLVAFFQLFMYLPCLRVQIAELTEVFCIISDYSLKLKDVSVPFVCIVTYTFSMILSLNFPFLLR